MSPISAVWFCILLMTLIQIQCWVFHISLMVANVLVAVQLSSAQRVVLSSMLLRVLRAYGVGTIRYYLTLILMYYSGWESQTSFHSSQLHRWVSLKGIQNICSYLLLHWHLNNSQPHQMQTSWGEQIHLSSHRITYPNRQPGSYCISKIVS